jgi:hypothetical protein
MEKTTKALARTQNHYKDWYAKGNAKIIDNHTTFLNNLLTDLDTTKELSTNVSMGDKDSLN